MNWYALQVWTSREAWVSDGLRRKSIEHYLPLVRSRRRWSDRLKILPEPLFPGYLFARFDPDDAPKVLKAAGVFQVLGDGRNAIPVDDGEIEGIRMLVDSGVPLGVLPEPVAGQAVRIHTGPLTGLEGTILRTKHGPRVVVRVNLLCQAVSAEVDLDWLEPVEDSRRPLRAAT